MKYLLPIIILLSLSCRSYSVHEQNMITQNKRMMIHDQKSRNKQQLKKPEKLKDILDNHQLFNLMRKFL